MGVSPPNRPSSSQQAERRPSLEFGLLFAGDASVNMDPATHLRICVNQVREARKAGFSYILMGQHFLFNNFRWLQPVPTLSRLAAEGEGMWFGTCVLLLPLYNPIILAEELATLDIATNGRFIFGAGLGYRPDEFTFLGVPIQERVSRFEEGLQLIKLLWTQPEVTFEGKHWKLDKAPTHIRPVSKPHPPIWIGGQKDVGIRRAARLGDAWPITPEVTRPQLQRQLAVYRQEREKLGKPVGKLPFRRNIAIARNRAEAVEKYRRWALEPNLTYARSGHLVFEEKSLIENFEKVIGDCVILGSPEQCIEQLRALLTEFPVYPLLFRAHWPSMTEQEVLDAIRMLGREILPALRDL